VNRRGKAFFERWVASNLSQREPWTTRYPTPAAALGELRAAAARENIDENELQADVGDLVDALMNALVATPREIVPVEPARCASRDPAEAMELAINYLDGFRDVVGRDTGLAAHVVLHNLARQGFVLNAVARSPKDERSGRKVDGAYCQHQPVPIPGDVRPGLRAFLGSDQDHGATEAEHHAASDPGGLDRDGSASHEV
jgi:hypothetical protein